MSDATLHALSPDPDDFAASIADQIGSFIVAVTEVAKGEDPDSAVPFLLLEVSQLLLAGGGSARTRTSCPRSATSPTSARSRTWTTCASGSP